MGWNENMGIDIKKNKKPLMINQADDFQNTDIENIIDEVIISIISDAKSHNNGNLEIIKPIFQSGKPIAELDCDKKLILKLAYLKKT